MAWEVAYMEKIRLENVTKIFGKRPERALKLMPDHTKEEILTKTGQTIGVNDVSFEVKEGEAFVVMGLSGSGKSTLIRCINRLIDPNSGSIYINDEDITKMDKEALGNLRRGKISMVFQSFAIFPHRTVLENTAYGLKIMGVAEKERLEKAAETLELVGLDKFKDQYPSQLSGGMQQRVGLARALATDPEILLMDEAFSALDPLIRKDMQSELIKIQTKMQKTIVFITHDLDEALRIGDRIALMRDGEVIQIGTPEEILTSPKTAYVKSFVEDVDRSRVLTAEMIMEKNPPLVTYPKDGPRLALRLMKRNGLSSIFVVNKQNNLLGLVTAESALQAIEDNETDLDKIMNKDISTASPDTTLNDMFALLTGKNKPLAIIDNQNEFQGVVVRGNVMAKLAEGDL